jgi:alpha-mannosidase
VIQELGDDVWRMGNGLIELDFSSEGILQVRDAQGCDQLSAPLRLERYQDRGEFWDAWDLAADYGEHSLGVDVLDGFQWIEQGPLVAHAVLRRRFGSSALRMDLRLMANRPWLELICSINWSQRHELLRLTMPLARSAVRVAADTSGGVIERPASPITAREMARWELPVISWAASQAAAPGGGLAVLLDGPQGVDWDADRLGVSLLRGPTWPDPGRGSRLASSAHGIDADRRLLERGGRHPGCYRISGAGMVGTPTSTGKTVVSCLARQPHSNCSSKEWRWGLLSRP